MRLPPGVLEGYKGRLPRLSSTWWKLVSALRDAVGREAYSLRSVHSPGTTIDLGQKPVPGA